MNQISWSLQATKDLQTIYRFYRNQNIKAANKIYKQIKQDTERLKEFSYLASIEPLLCDEPEIYRSLIVLQKFKVIYTVEENHINVVHIWDCRRNPDILFNEIKNPE